MIDSKLIRLLLDGGHSLVIENGGTTHTFDGRGISDLHSLLSDRPGLLHGASVADKVIGKGAAAIMALGKVSEVFGNVISTHALALLRSEGIPVSFGLEVPDIINRNSDGICPVEQLCHACATPDECLPLITRFLSSIKQ